MSWGVRMLLAPRPRNMGCPSGAVTTVSPLDLTVTHFYLFRNNRSRPRNPARLEAAPPFSHCLNIYFSVLQVHLHYATMKSRSDGQRMAWDGYIQNRIAQS
jgi:hypothetical protein